jgi:hypothetical protein
MKTTGRRLNLPLKAAADGSIDSDERGEGRRRRKKMRRRRRR